MMVVSFPMYVKVANIGVGFGVCRALDSSDASSPLCLRMLEEGSRVHQKHNCLCIVFIAAIATTCFGRAWPSSGHC
jgi:hypothetical protein